jgi:hypothetical protein
MNKEIMTLTEKTILYLIRKLGREIMGKKIMKLMFLIENYDFDTGSIKPLNRIGNTFFIRDYGVFSQTIVDSVRKMMEEKVIVDGFRVKTDCEPTLHEGIKETIDKVIDEFGSQTGDSLEVDILKMLNIQPHEKKMHFGKKIEELV